MVLPICALTLMLCQPKRFAQWVTATRERRSGARRASLCRSGQAKRSGCAFHLSRRRSRPVQRHPERRNAAGRSVAARIIRRHRGQKDESPWQAQLERDPVRPADRHGRDRRHGRWPSSSFLAWVTLKGYVPYLWREWITSVDHKRIGVMYIVLALIMLLRGFADAIMMRSQQARRGRRRAGISAAGAFRPDLLGARHDHDLLHGDAVRDRADELRRAAAARRPRHGLPDA